MKRGLLLLLLFCFALPTMGQVTIQAGCGKEEITISPKPGEKNKIKKILEKAYLWVSPKGGNLVLNVNRDSMGTMLRRVESTLNEKGKRTSITPCPTIPTTYSEIISAISYIF